MQGRRLLIAALLLFSARRASAGDLDDTVFLKAGGRARGLIVEESPTAGVRLKMPDGSIRTFAAKDVDHVTYGAKAPAPAPLPPTPAPAPAPAPTAPPPAATGTLHVETSEPATVSVDGGDYGRAPQDVAALPPGKHKVVVRFESGGEASRVVLVRAGATTPVVLEVGAASASFRAHEGVHFGVGAEGLIEFGDLTSAGGRAFGRMNVGLSPGIEFRVDALVGATSGSHSITSEVAVPITARGDFQFNLGSVYAMSVGIDGGVEYVTRNVAAVSSGPLGTTATYSASGTTVRELFGLHASVLTFRFGEKKEFMVAAQEGALGHFGNGGGTTIEQTFSFTYLFLP